MKEVTHYIVVRTAREGFTDCVTVPPQPAEFFHHQTFEGALGEAERLAAEHTHCEFIVYGAAALARNRKIEVLHYDRDAIPF